MEKIFLQCKIGSNKIGKNYKYSRNSEGLSTSYPLY